MEGTSFCFAGTPRLTRVTSILVWPRRAGFHVNSQLSGLLGTLSSGQPAESIGPDSYLPGKVCRVTCVPLLS